MFQNPSLHIEFHWHLSLHHMNLAVSSSVHDRKRKEESREKVREPAVTSHVEGKDAFQLLAFYVEATRLSTAPRPYADCLPWLTLPLTPMGNTHNIYSPHRVSFQSEHTTFSARVKLVHFPPLGPSRDATHNPKACFSLDS